MSAEILPRRKGDSVLEIDYTNELRGILAQVFAVKWVLELYYVRPYTNEPWVF